MNEPTSKQLRDHRRYASDAYREWNRERMRTLRADSEYAEREREQKREKYHSDPLFRLRQCQYKTLRRSDQAVERAEQRARAMYA